MSSEIRKSLRKRPRANYSLEQYYDDKIGDTNDVGMHTSPSSAKAEKTHDGRKNKRVKRETSLPTESRNTDRDQPTTNAAQHKWPERRSNHSKSLSNIDPTADTPRFSPDSSKFSSPELSERATPAQPTSEAAASSIPPTATTATTTDTNTSPQNTTPPTPSSQQLSAVRYRFFNPSIDFVATAPYAECSTAKDLFDMAMEYEIADHDTRILLIKLPGNRETRMRVDNEKAFREKIVVPLDRLLADGTSGVGIVVNVRKYK